MLLCMYCIMVHRDCIGGVGEFTDVRLGFLGSE